MLPYWDTNIPFMLPHSCALLALMIPTPYPNGALQLVHSWLLDRSFGLDLVHLCMGVVHKPIDPYGTSHNSWWMVTLWPSLLYTLGRQTSNFLRLTYSIVLLTRSLFQSDALSKCFLLYLWWSLIPICPFKLYPYKLRIPAYFMPISTFSWTIDWTTIARQ